MLSCSVTREKAEGDPELKPVVEALQNNEVRISLLSTVPSTEIPFIDLSGGSYVIRITGEKASVSLPRIDDTTPNDSGTISALGAYVADFSCQKTVADKSRVIYLLKDPYSNVGYAIRVVCYYSGMASVTVGGYRTGFSKGKFNAEIQQQQ